MATRGEVFTYVGVTWDGGDLVCTYDLDGRRFAERFTLPDGPGRGTPALEQVARLLFLVAGVSYYKTAAPPIVDLGDTPVSDADRALLQAFYVDGLGEYAVVNDLDLTDITFVGGTDRVVAAPVADGPPLVPFGGGIDSVVAVEAVKAQDPDAALFVLGSYDAIEQVLAVTGLPVLRASRTLDPQVLDRGNGFLNGHVPVTGILSLVALAVAVITGRGSVVMSNEHSASEATVTRGGRDVNHQWSKSAAFEELLRSSLAAAVPGLEYYSLLRARSELWVAQRFAQLPRYHPVFRSCNRAFHVAADRRLTEWCGECDKCCFIDLILAPYVPRTDLDAVFSGREPLSRTDLLSRFRSLLGDDELDKPFECVGDAGECRAAVALAAARPDRVGNPVLAALAAGLADHPSEAELLEPLGPDHVPDRLRADVLV